MKKILTVILIALCLFFCVGCDTNHEHTFEYIQYEETHFKQYTCGCPSPEIMGMHNDIDNDNICDECEYKYKVTNSDLLCGMYCLSKELNESFCPYISLEKNNQFNFISSYFSSYITIGEYNVLDDLIYLKELRGEKEYICIFKIADNSLIYQSGNLSELYLNDGDIFIYCSN